MTHLFTVTDAFQIANRGCVLVPGIPESGPSLRVGDPIILRFPTGETIRTEIRGLELINYRTVPREIAAPILLPAHFRKESIPIGTEVYSENET